MQRVSPLSTSGPAGQPTAKPPLGRMPMRLRFDRWFPAIIDGLVAAATFGERQDGHLMMRFPWWWFARSLWHRDAYVTWRHPEWWAQRRWPRDFINLFFARLGFWDIGMEGYFNKGRWRWDFWRSPRSWWRLRITGLELALENAQRRLERMDVYAKAEYERGKMDGREEHHRDLTAQLRAIQSDVQVLKHSGLT